MPPRPLWLAVVDILAETGFPFQPKTSDRRSEGAGQNSSNPERGSATRSNVASQQVYPLTQA